jgi:hypothetical protein
LCAVRPERRILLPQDLILHAFGKVRLSDPWHTSCATETNFSGPSGRQSGSAVGHSKARNDARPWCLDWWCGFLAARYRQAPARGKNGQQVAGSHWEWALGRYAARTGTGNCRFVFCLGPRSGQTCVPTPTPRVGTRSLRYCHERADALIRRLSSAISQSDGRAFGTCAH